MSISSRIMSALLVRTKGRVLMGRLNSDILVVWAFSSRRWLARNGPCDDWSSKPMLLHSWSHSSTLAIKTNQSSSMMIKQARLPWQLTAWRKHVSTGRRRSRIPLPPPCHTIDDHSHSSSSVYWQVYNSLTHCSGYLSNGDTQWTFRGRVVLSASSISQCTPPENKFLLQRWEEARGEEIRSERFRERVWPDLNQGG